MTPGAWRHAVDILLVGAAIACAAVVLAMPRIPQAPDYHRFADTRTLFGVPNALNVVSNAPFAVVGLAGLIVALRGRAFADAVERRSYVVFFAGVTLTTFGSAWYHLAPDNDRLVWDRLPMAIGFMALLTAVVADRVSVRAGRVLLFPLLVAGCASVLYWHWTETRGTGDLRFYLLVQFGSLVAIVLMLCLYRSRYSGAEYLVAGLAAYAAAKGFELGDRIIFDATYVVSGHTLKHLAAGAGVALVAVMLVVRMVISAGPAPYPGESA
jgi:hypothetical protein